MSRGRPSRKDENLDNISLKLAAEGKTNKQIANIIGVGLSTFSRWLAEDDGYRDALAKAKREFDAANVENMLLKRCLGMKANEIRTLKDAEGKVIETIHTERELPPDPGCLALYLRNRMPDVYCEKIRTDIKVTANILEHKSWTLREISEAFEMVKDLPFE